MAHHSPDAKRGQHISLCVRHGKPLEFYCRTDDTAICSRCLLHQHKGHDIIDEEEQHGQTQKKDHADREDRHGPTGELKEKECLLPLSELLSELGLSDLQGGKLTLSSVLEINNNTLSDTPPQGLQELPWSFLRKLIMSNLNARNLKCDKKQSYSYIDDEDDDDDDVDDSDAMNPLDLIIALFHCADPFLQQEMVSKMSLCQFAVPLLLPNCDTQQRTLMLWAMRDLVKNYKPHSSSGEGTFVEGRILEMELPMVSFVRVGKSSLPKSQTLNRLLSSPSQHIEAFIHHDMPCGDVPRRISDGLVEVFWYLPCGKKNIDIFTQPVAVANLRGDGKLFKAQLYFLCQTSAAVFIFSDDLEGDLSPFTNTENKAELFLVTNSQREKIEDTCKGYKFEKKNLIIRRKKNESEFAKTLRACVGDVLEKPNVVKRKMLDLATLDQKIVLVDENSVACKKGKQCAEKISVMVKSVVEFKENQLPLHGDLWKKISKLEKERFRPNREKNLEEHLSKLVKQESDLRMTQQKEALSDAMSEFIIGISQPQTERLYFLKWLKMILDTLTRQDLSSLRQKYKDCCSKHLQEKEEIEKLDKQISNCSLGPEHFFRELGQIYECACSLKENEPARERVQHLPGLCAQMLLDGFPVELMDGDASNIPMKWISAVLTELHHLVDTKSKILVLTVLGVQSTGKSTLLNTMFGVQFAVSSGRCTRGAFMLLMKVSETLRPELNCDFIMVIDTEGLKSPELATLDTSYEHDNELATLVIGLSDITIINVAMENNQEMKDVLQIAVHAFLRMKAVGKSPRCLFVHQNVSDMAAKDNNIKDRNKLVEQLNEMTQAAAKMEKKEAHSFSDVMKYDPETDSHYIPGLWHGTPPMAPVNTGYSEAVYELKKNLIHLFKADEVKSNDATQFLTWSKDLWTAVKYENFIFNFRNSLVANAYLDLCTHYTSWEWTFQTAMNSWLIAKTTVISNFGVTQNDQTSTLETTLKAILIETQTKLHKEEEQILTNITEYFKGKDKKVDLVVKYKQDFISSAKSLRQQTEQSITQCLQQAVDIKKGMEKLNTIKDQQTSMIEEKVKELLQHCRKSKIGLSKDDLKEEFDNMWTQIMSELTVINLQQTDVFQNSVYLLRDNLSAKGVFEMLNNIKLETKGHGEFKVDGQWFGVLGKVKQLFTNKDISDTQDSCDLIITKCRTLVEDQTSSMRQQNTDYNDTYIRELLKTIDDQIKDKKMPTDCVVNLKIHIIGSAARCFQKAHDAFNTHNDPQEHLKKSRETYRNSFLEKFNEKDQCLKKAQEFTEKCVKPAVQEYVSKYLGQEIAEDMKTGEEGKIFSTRKRFQFSILKQLLDEHSSKTYMKYTKSYNVFMMDWIKQQIVQRMSSGRRIDALEKELLSTIVGHINNFLSNSAGSKDIKVFIQAFCSALKDQLVIPRDALNHFLILISVDTDQFTTYLKDLIKEMKESLAKEYDRSITSITRKIEKLPSKPHDLLFSRLCGCGHQCPFCGAPCEAGGQTHQKHNTSMHRSRAFGGRTWDDSKKLVIDICTTAVNSDCRFKNSKTNGEWYPYKEYRKIYPDWEIAGNANADASDYWKYVLTKFNKEMAEAYNAQPADIPWKDLAYDHALNSLKKAFNIE